MTNGRSRAIVCSANCLRHRIYRPNQFPMNRTNLRSFSPRWCWRRAKRISVACKELTNGYDTFRESPSFYTKFTISCRWWYRAHWNWEYAMIDRTSRRCYQKYRSMYWIEFHREYLPPEAHRTRSAAMIVGVAFWRIQRKLVDKFSSTIWHGNLPRI